MTSTTASDETSFNAAAQARRVAQEAARRAGCGVDEVEDMETLRAVAQLLEDVWGRTPEGVPFGSELLRSLVHAGGAVTCARDVAAGRLAGAAVLVRGPVGASYSLVAAAARGAHDRGIGHALKLRQRAWALEQGLTSMRWTFDPLVSRNARFNLAKLGAGVEDYVEGFYGRMHDQLNGSDDSDRLVAVWQLAGPAAVAATEGTATEPPGPPGPATAPVLADGPDGLPAYVGEGTTRWLRAPHDVVELRRVDPRQAAGWRQVARDAFTDAFASGLRATGFTRTGWYVLRAPHDTPGATS